MSEEFLLKHPPTCPRCKVAALYIIGGYGTVTIDSSEHVTVWRCHNCGHRIWETREAKPSDGGYRALEDQIHPERLEQDREIRPAALLKAYRGEQVDRREIYVRKGRV